MRKILIASILWLVSITQPMVQGTTSQVSLVTSPVKVGWDFCSDTRVVGYFVKYGIVGKTNLTVIDTQNTNIATLVNPSYGTINFVYATSYDAYGNESDPSEILYFSLSGIVKPSISVQPTNCFGLVGGQVLFQARATGSAPLRYQWRRQGVPLAGATNSQLQLANLVLAQTGNYDAVVTNFYGAATSQVARLTVATSTAFGETTSTASTVLANTTTSPPVNAGLGWNHGLAILRNGTVLGWGDNSWKQATIPTDLGTQVAVSGGAYHSIALNSNGTVKVWGMGLCGQLNVPAQLSAVKAISAGGFHNLALTSDGKITAWGYNIQGQCNIPTGLPKIVAIAAGSYHSLALTQDGKVIAWGDNTYGQCNVPVDLPKVVGISAGGYFNAVVLANGSVRCWGDGRYGQLEPPANLGSITSVACGSAHVIALRTDGSVISWGRSQYLYADDLAGVQNVGQVFAGGDRSLLLGGK